MGHRPNSVKLEEMEKMADLEAKLKNADIEATEPTEDEEGPE